MKKNILIIAMIVVTFLVGLYMGKNLSNNKTEVKEVKTYTQKDGDIITEYNDNSFKIVNKGKNLYSFQPANMGDWDYKVKNENELNNVIDTYIELNSN